MATQVNVRPMSDGDLALVNSWRTDPRIEGFEHELERGGQIIELGDVPVGWIDPHPAYAPAWQELLGPSVGEAPWTLDLLVVPERWGAGIARAAIRAVSQRCLADGATSMVVNVTRENVASRRAFEGAGWVVVPTSEEDIILRYAPEDGLEVRDP